MKAHREKREFPVYNLVLSKRVPELKEEPAPEQELTSFPTGKIKSGGSFIDWGGDSTFTFSDNTIEVKKLPLDAFSEWLSNFLDRLSSTPRGFTGYYDFRLGPTSQDRFSFECNERNRPEAGARQRASGRSGYRHCPEETNGQSERS